MLKPCHGRESPRESIDSADPSLKGIRVLVSYWKIFSRLGKKMKMLITILENRIEESRRVINYLKEQIKVLEEIDLILKEYDEASPDYRRNNQQLIEKVAELSGEEKELDECQNALANTKKELAGQRLFFEKQSKSESDDCKGMESSLAMRMIG